MRRNQWRAPASSQKKLNLHAKVKMKTKKKTNRHVAVKSKNLKSLHVVAKSNQKRVVLVAPMTFMMMLNQRIKRLKIIYKFKRKRPHWIKEGPVKWFSSANQRMDLILAPMKSHIHCIIVLLHQMKIKNKSKINAIGVIG